MWEYNSYSILTHILILEDLIPEAISFKVGFQIENPFYKEMDYFLLASFSKD